MDVLENRKEHLSSFIRLNEEWISKYFSLEKVDLELAENPGKIIDEGGYIFSIEEGGEVVGTCALLNKNAGEYELARMAVSPIYQGYGFGNKLMSAALNKAAQIGAKKVTLVSNTKLSAAIGLYKKFGCKVVSLGQHPVYSRANIVMAWCAS